MDVEGNDPTERSDAEPTSPPPPTTDARPAFEPPPAFGPPASFGSVPSAGTPSYATPPYGPGIGAAAQPNVPPPPPLPLGTERAQRTGGSGLGARLLGSVEPVDAPRPVPTWASMLAVGGGLLVALGLFSLLSELDGYDQRMTGLGISLVFLVLGVVISTVNRSSRAAAGGVAISVLSVLPLTVYLWANADVFGELAGDAEGNVYDGIRGVVTLMLLTAAAVWLLGYLVGPGRRFGVYLGAALVAIWLVPVFNLQVNAWEDTFSFSDSSSVFEPVPDTTFDFDSDFDSDFESDFDSDFDSGFDLGDPTFDEPEISDPSTKVGIVSLVFGAAYLAAAAWRDRRGDVRMGTAVLVPAILALLTASSSLTGHVGWAGWAFLSMAIGGALLAVGLRGQRRATSWIGMLVATGGLASLVTEGLDQSPRAMGAALTVVGVAIVLVVGQVARSKPNAGPSSDPAGAAGGAGGGDEPAATVGDPAAPRPTGQAF